MILDISVIIPVYNASSFIRKAVESAHDLNEVTEILLIEDCSPDNSLQICELLEKEFHKVKLFQHPDKGNHGAAASRNLGLEHATRKFISFLDADDYYLPNRLDAEKALFKDSKVEGVFNAIGTEFLSEKGKADFKEKFKDNELTTVRRPAEGRDVFYGLLGLKNDFGSFFHLNGLTVKAESLRKNKLKFNENLRVHQDSDFIIKLSYHCNLKSGNISEPVAIRGVHDNNRITKIKAYSEKFYERQLLLWRSLHDWSSKQNRISGKAKKIIIRNTIMFEAANLSGLKKFIYYCFHAIVDPELLKTRYRFHVLKF